MATSLGLLNGPPKEPRYEYVVGAVGESGAKICTLAFVGKSI